MSLSNMQSKLSRKEMKTIIAGSGGFGHNCSLTGNEQILYSGGEPVSYVCEWKCDEGLRWGGCSVWG